MTKDRDNNGVARVEGTTKVEPEKLAEFKKLMTEEVIPKIVQTVEERRLRAAQTRTRQLKY
jgi:hypothetical protein